MNDRPWWIIALKTVLWLLIMAGIGAWLARSRFNSRADSEARRLHHPASSLIVTLTCMGFFAVLALIPLWVPDTQVPLWTSLLFGGFALLPLPLLVDYVLSRFDVSELGMEYRPLLRARRQLKWLYLRQVGFHPVMKYFRLEWRSGEVLRVSLLLMGLPTFARLLLAHAPAASIQRDALPVLRETAAGNPPSAWF